MMDLVERDAALQLLTQRLQAAGEQGQIVFVVGEAGIGKTSVLRAFAGMQAAARHGVWWGACDALQTPQPLAPLLDIARETHAAFARHLDGPRLGLFEAVLHELRAAPARLVVIEDAHWADDATLDLLKFLGRRIARTRALLVVSFRDDEVGAGHPLRRLLGELSGALRTYIELAALSVDGVATLARRALREPAGLHAATEGNPFFVTELLRHRIDDTLPRSVQDLVLARFARLAKPAQAIVRLASCVPGGIERRLVDAVLAPALADLEACFDSGLIVAGVDTLVFRHELARVAVQAALAMPVAQTLHAQLLRALADGDDRTGAVSSSRLAHHAALANDAAALRRHAPAAGAEALRRGAYREAARHFRGVLASTRSHRGDTADPERPRWLEAHAEACQRIDALAEAIAVREELGTLHARSGDTLAEAVNLSRLAILLVHMLRNAEADAASRRAIALLESLPPGPAHAVAYVTEAKLRMLNRDADDCIAWSRQAIALARAQGDRPQLCAALSMLGTALMFVDYDAGAAQTEVALRMARDESLPNEIANALSNLGSASGELMRLAPAERWLREAIIYATERELDGAVHYATAWLALCELLRGRWTGAADRAGAVLARADVAGITRVMAGLALGRVRLRRGDPGADEAIDAALLAAGASDTLQRIAPVRAARAEAAYARGDLAATAREAQAALPLAIAHRHGWFIGELAFWAWSAGALSTAPPGCAEPHALQIAGDWRGAAVAWQRLGCPYEQARALADGDAPAQQQALALFEQLGARPAADAVRRRLHEAGVRGLARGARASTRAHAFGLTTRELQVLRLLCEGLRNAEIAQRLSRSVRTVDHHLAAVFAKLGVDSRAAAVAAAQRAGVTPRPPQSGQAPPAI